MPDAGFSGTDSFVYTLDDGNGGTDTATGTLTVDPVNDAPVAPGFIFVAASSYQTTFVGDLLSNAQASLTLRHLCVTIMAGRT